MKDEATTDHDTEWLRRYYDDSASDYDGWMRYYDPVMLGDGRSRLCSRAIGRTLELAIGTGLNLPFYLPAVQLTGIDLSPAMLAIAERRANTLGLAANLRQGNAQALDFPDEYFDTVVATLLLSTIPDDRQTAAEAWRVLRPGGRLLILDHVRSLVRPVRWLEQLLNPIMSRRTGVHLLRNPLDYLAAVGFTTEWCNRTRWGIVEEIVARKG